MAAQYPYSSSENEKPKEYVTLMETLREDLQRKGIISRIEYVGSTYKGTRIDSSDYDNLFVVRPTSGIVAYATHSWLHARLRIGGKHGSLVMPNKTRNAFKGEFQKAINELNLNATMKLVDNGPAIAILYRCKGVEFSVDADLCYEVPDKKGRYQMFVPKPPNIGQEDLWKLTTDVQEKKKMSNIDDGNGVGRQAVRILKGVKNRECGLKSLKSCLFEHVLYYMKDEHPDKSYWLATKMETILTDMITYIRVCVLKGKLKNYFVPEENLLPRQMKPMMKENYLNRLDKLRNNVELVY